MIKKRVVFVTAGLATVVIAIAVLFVAWGYYTDNSSKQAVVPTQAPTGFGIPSAGDAATAGPAAAAAAGTPAADAAGGSTTRGGTTSIPGGQLPPMRRADYPGRSPSSGAPAPGDVSADPSTGGGDSGGPPTGDEGSTQTTAPAGESQPEPPAETLTLEMIDQKIVDAVKLFRAEQFEQCADTIRAAGKAIDQLAAGGDADVVQALGERHKRVARASAMLAEKGIDVGQLEPLPTP